MHSFLLVFLWVMSTLFSGIIIDKPVKEHTALQLKWNRSSNQDAVENAITGLAWALSHCGAALPHAPYAFEVQGELITLKPGELGFDHKALKNLLKLHSKILESEEYRVNHYIDLGRYVTLLMGSAAHYYEITGVPKQLDLLLSNYELQSEKGYINNSAISLGHRIIRFSAQQPFKQLFIAFEVDSLSNSVYEYETIEMMANGQLRYGVFDALGNRVDSADPAHSNAGKPAKCIWCHESNIQPLFTIQKNFPGFLEYLKFKQQLSEANQTYHDQKIELKTGVDFLKKQQHTQTELLYISFMEPSAQRLSIEWQIPLSEVLQRLTGLSTHQHEEFAFLGDLYHRKDVERLAPFQSLIVSNSVRERSEIEINHLD